MDEPCSTPAGSECSACGKDEGTSFGTLSTSTSSTVRTSSWFGMERKEVIMKIEVMESSMDATQVDVDRVPYGVVPSSLPQSLRSDPTHVEQGDISRLYDVPGSVQRVQDRDLTQAQLIALHLRSYRNILEYELSDMQQLRRRFLRYFASVFIELVDLCYPDRGNTALVNLAVLL